MLSLQEHLPPAVGRRFPDTIVIDHDYLAYHRAATASLWTTGRFTTPTRRLEEFGPARFTVYGDHLDRCGLGLRAYADPRNDRVTDEFWMSGHMELDSPLVVNFPQVAGTQQFLGLVEQAEHGATITATEETLASAVTGVSVDLVRHRSERVL